MTMVRLCKELRVLATALILSLALALGLGSTAFAGLPDMPAGLHDVAGVHHASSSYEPCMQAPCSDQNADCISSLAHCSGAGCAALVEPVEARGVAHSGQRIWALAGALCLRGIDPLVARHPPRHLA